MAKKKTAPPLPGDWKQAVQGKIQRDPNLGTDTKTTMIQLLGKDDVAEAAGLLWARTEIQQAAGALAYIVTVALYHLAAHPETDPAVRVTRSRWLNAAQKAASEKECREYGILAKLAPEFRPKELAQRAALWRLRRFFQMSFGRPMNKVTAHFMRAAFGVGWNERVVRIRACASQWGDYLPDWEREREPGIVDAIQAVRMLRARRHTKDNKT